MNGRSDEPLAIPPLPPRPPEGHKGTFGRVLIVGGSPGMTGAVILAARAALRGGAGLVTVALCGSLPHARTALLSNAVTAAVPEATQILLPEHDAPGVSAVACLEEHLGAGSRFQVVAIGPGLGTSSGARALLDSVLRGYPGPIVVDADGLNLLAAHPPAADVASRCVLTPHPGEFERLSGEKPTGDATRRAAAQRFVEARGGVLVLKGHRTVVAERGRVHVNTTGNSGMATGGSGDVLTGVIAALLAQGMPRFDAAVLAVYLHGLSGDLATAELGPHGVIAGDLVERLPRAFLRRAAAEATKDPA